MADILYEKKGHIAYVTFNRPEKKNTWTPNAFVLLADAWQDIQADDNIRCVILTGTGTEAFSAGGDLGSLIPLFTGAKVAETEEEKRFMQDLETYTNHAVLKGLACYKPIIGAVNGVALGGGFEILQCTDIRIAAKGVKMGLPEVKRALVPGAGSLVRLIRQIPHAHAMEILLTGEMVEAEQLLQWGFLNYVVDPDQLMIKAEAIAAKIIANGPIAVQASKEVALRSLTENWEQAFAIERELSAKVMSSADAQEGPKAFKEKRVPTYQGK
ncbi:enoyl-CoA hydratase/isomerase family protein [Oceanicoccus sp. KOV_DT_Chl]|uniref:enoyl-CoA hydratase/isomerase family protein n=1 Tax=Oceanicoccus sp. KOV_DT_Chl TaxID=1904639 RepID=UPI000C7B9DB6|nr:enoyl-CoA hydratase-related protein [Oceanicoccus sp. KOV_DT_Chl]